jgi:outer membrane protein assembly factor BamE (lipoprotein component of BamABCDE complex)
MYACYLAKPARMMLLITALLLTAFLSGCFTVGHDFPVDQVPAIKIGKTTQDDIKSMFGSPWRVGAEDGQRTWTYGKYRYSAFSETSTQDLVVRFNDRGVVASFTFNTTEHQE